MHTARIVAQDWLSLRTARRVIATAIPFAGFAVIPVTNWPVSSAQ